MIITEVHLVLGTIKGLPVVESEVR
jgi:hypothetical protein